ncbi:MAG: hypothetical protein ACI83I_000803 [Bacteroidia bacterium]|jgi:hypothetical protein
MNRTQVYNNLYTYEHHISDDELSLKLLALSNKLGRFGKVTLCLDVGLNNYPTSQESNTKIRSAEPMLNETFTYDAHLLENSYYDSFGSESPIKSSADIFVICSDDLKLFGQENEKGGLFTQYINGQN